MPILFLTPYPSAPGHPPAAGVRDGHRTIRAASIDLFAGKVPVLTHSNLFMV
jgi:hypothetical protein